MLTFGVTKTFAKGFLKSGLCLIIICSLSLKLTHSLSDSLTHPLIHKLIHYIIQTFNQLMHYIMIDKNSYYINYCKDLRLTY